MSERSIKRDTNQARTALKGLTIYGVRVACQGKKDEAEEIRNLVDAMCVYWGLDGEKDWTKEFDEKVRRAYQGMCAGGGYCSKIIKLRTINGLYRYAEEMSIAQGADEVERISEIPNVIRRLGAAWKISSEDIQRSCNKIDDIVESLREQQAMEEGPGISL